MTMRATKRFPFRRLVVASLLQQGCRPARLRLARRLARVAAAGAFIVAGCNSILGNEAGILDPDWAGALEAGSGDAVDDGGGSSDATGNDGSDKDILTSNEATSDAPTADASTVGTVGQPCTPN